MALKQQARRSRAQLSRYHQAAGGRAGAATRARPATLYAKAGAAHRNRVDVNTNTPAAAGCRPEAVWSGPEFRLMAEPGSAAGRLRLPWAIQRSQPEGAEAGPPSSHLFALWYSRRGGRRDHTRRWVEAGRTPTRSAAPPQAPGAAPEAAGRPAFKWLRSAPPSNAHQGALPPTGCGKGSRHSGSAHSRTSAGEAVNPSHSSPF